MECEVTVTGEGYYDLQVPENYKPSHHMPDYDYHEWIIIVEEARKAGNIRSELADRILISMERLPSLEEDQLCSVSFSGGKDSQVIFMLAAMRYGKEKLMSMFADTHDEWPETLESIKEFEEWMKVQILVADSMGIHKLLRDVIPVWPKAGVRHCTKNLKMLPQRDLLDELGFNQVRKRGKVAFRSGEEYEIKYKAPITISGERWYESKNRSNLPFDSRDEILLRYTHRPVLDWHIEDIWDFIFWIKAPYNPIYTMGVKRAACAGCIFANVEELYLLGKYYPNMLADWVITEEAIGVPRRGKQSLKEIYQSLKDSGQLGELQIFQY